MVTAIVTWWLAVQVLGLAGLPLTMFLFRSLPDRGYAFSKSLGLLLTGYGAWLLAMFGLGTFSAPLLLIVALLIGGGGFAIHKMRSAQRSADPPGSSAALSSPFGVLNWRLVLGYEGLFLVALIFLAWLRSYNPDPWGTERPMDFAFFNAIRNNSGFPPHDPWLAGYSINYYYFGYLLMAAVALISGLDPAVAYNLSLALIFALTALGIAGILYNLMALTITGHQAATAGGGQRGAGVLRPLIILLGVLMVLMAGNQAGALQVLVGSERVVALDGRQLVAAVTQALGGAEQITLPYPAYTADGEFGTFTTLDRSDKAADFNWWWPSRVLWDTYTLQEPGQPARQVARYTITEFPFFSFWLGDMHPHVMALPFGLLALALALATIARPALPAFARSRSGWLDLLLTAIVLGSLYTINSWDLPTYLLLYTGALLLLYLRLDGVAGPVRWRQLGQQVTLVLLACVLLFMPFYLTFHSLVGSAQPLIDLPVIGKITQIIAPFAASKSGLHAFLIIFGLFALPLIAFVYLGFRPDGHTPAPPAPGSLGIVADQTGEATATSPYRLVWGWVAGPWSAPLLLLIGLLLGFPLLGLLGLGLFAFGEALRRHANAAASCTLLVIALGCAIGFGTELIYIRDVFEGSSQRMNTIFKFYYQIWLLWGTLAAYALWWLLTQTSRLRRLVAYGTAVCFVVLLAGGSVYPVINLRDMQTKGFQVGLAGRTPRESTPAGAASIAWLRANVAPESVVLEMVSPDGGSYNGVGYAGVSASTGLPTVLGWVGHEHQWRGGDTAARAEIEPRKQDVELIYSTLDPEQARELLAKYNVSYIYIGSLERQSYLPESLAKFDRIAQVVFQIDDVTIYQVP